MLPITFIVTGVQLRQPHDFHNAIQVTYMYTHKYVTLISEESYNQNKAK